MNGYVDDRPYLGHSQYWPWPISAWSFTFLGCKQCHSELVLFDIDLWPLTATFLRIFNLDMHNCEQLWTSCILKRKNLWIVDMDVWNKWIETNVSIYLYLTVGFHCTKEYSILTRIAKLNLWCNVLLSMVSLKRYQFTKANDCPGDLSLRVADWWPEYRCTESLPS